MKTNDQVHNVNIIPSCELFFITNFDQWQCIRAGISIDILCFNLQKLNFSQ